LKRIEELNYQANLAARALIRWWDAAMCSTRISFAAIGKIAAEMALALVGIKAQVRPRTELINPKLVVRASSTRK
jgi:DNA-binding LacI/PurR family transcriptional regulator